MYPRQIRVTRWHNYRPSCPQRVKANTQPGPWNTSLPIMFPPPFPFSRSAFKIHITKVDTWRVRIRGWKRNRRSKRRKNYDSRSFVSFLNFNPEPLYVIIKLGHVLYCRSTISELNVPWYICIAHAYVYIGDAWLTYKTKLRDTTATISRPCLPTDPSLTSIHRSLLFQRTYLSIRMMFSISVQLPLQI